jgi:hypothetical protein
MGKNMMDEPQNTFLFAIKRNQNSSTKKRSFATVTFERF